VQKERAERMLTVLKGRGSSRAENYHNESGFSR
jgi:hypothetical protein